MNLLLVPRRFRISDQDLDSFILDLQDSLDWDPFYQEPTYTMTVTRTPQKTEAEAAAAIAATTAEATTEADVQPTAPSPTPTDKSIEDIKERTRLMEESMKKENHEQPPNTNALVKEVKELMDEDADGEALTCRDRQHEFERRTKTLLSPVAKKFIKAVQALLFQLDREKFSDDVSQEYGEALMNGVYALYEKLEEAREHCEEVLNDAERVAHGDYLKTKFEMVLTCERLFTKYFEEQEANKSRRMAEARKKAEEQAKATANLPSQPILTSTPYQSKPDQDHHNKQESHHGHHGPSPEFKGFENHHGHHEPSPEFKGFDYHHGERSHQYGESQGMPNYGFNSQRRHYHQKDQDYYDDQAQHKSHQGNDHQPQDPGQPQKKSNVGFKIYNDKDDSRAHTPSMADMQPSVIGSHHHTRFKLNEELALVEKWDGSQPRAYMAFRAQWKNFYQKMVAAQRSNMDIYYALLKVVDGPPKNLITTKYPNEMSYVNSIKRLDELFYNPTNLLRDMVHNLLKGQKMADTHESLLAGMTKLNDAWNDLNEAQLSNDQLKGLLFIAATEKNLSEESWKCWLEEQNDPKYQENPMAAFEIKTFLGSINKAMLNAQRRRNALGPSKIINDWNPEVKPKPQGNAGGSSKRHSTLYGSYNNALEHQEQPRSQSREQWQARRANKSCIFCGNQPHKYQLQCPRLKKMSVDQIYQTMNEAKPRIECRMCLCPGHITPLCPEMEKGFLKKCTVKEDNVECRKLHCYFLHKSKKSEKKANENSQPKPKQE